MDRRRSKRLQPRYNSLEAGGRDHGQIVVDSVRFADDTVLTSGSVTVSGSGSTEDIVVVGPVSGLATSVAQNQDKSVFQFTLPDGSQAFTVPVREGKTVALSIDSGAFGFMNLSLGVHYTVDENQQYSILTTTALNLSTRISYSN